MGDDQNSMKPASSEKAVFAQALERDSPEDRAAYLHGACEEDKALCRRVEDLLRAAEKAGDFLETPPAGLSEDIDSNTSASELREMTGDRIGRFKLLERIGEGGCGVVYMAEQQEPVRRRVALKVIKPGMDTHSVVARFEAERQALAYMDHPSIAKVFDGGATPTGRPYFVMELVRGLRITDFCNEGLLSTEARLRLFVQVCHAVQHAHQKGIIHRDLKPSNILVTVNDGSPVPKVIDFGIAKATGQRLTDKTVFTHFHAFIGTPAYTSPEQAEMSSVEIDTRSDIYSLGVLLYELLTGCTPFDGEQLLSAGLDEMRRIIREDEPARPSTQLTRLTAINATRPNAKSEADVARAPRPAPTKELIGSVQGDLDWIVMKCLEKDRARRYETAIGLATDIERHLNHEPIQARRVNALGRFWRWRRRRPAVAALSAGVLLLLILVSVFSTLAAWRVTSARHAEQDERAKAEAATRELRDVNARLTDTINLLELQRVEDLLRVNDACAGVAHLTAILRRDPSNAIAASRLVSVLVHRNWALPAATPMRHVDRVMTTSFSPDGRHVLSASWDKTAQFWDATTGSPVATLQHQDRVLSAGYSPSGARVVTTSADGGVRIWDAANGAPMNSLDHQRRKVRWAEFSPDGGSLVTACFADATAHLWDVASGTLTQELGPESSEVMMARFTPDGKRVVTASRLGSIRFWTVDSSTSDFRIDAHSGAIHALAFSPDGRMLVSAGEDGRARLWDVSTGEPAVPPLLHNDAVRHAAFSPDGLLLLTTSQDNSARLWSTTNGQALGQPLWHEGGVVFGEFSPDGEVVVTTSMDNSARLWETRTGKPFCQPLRQLEAILHASFSPDGRKLVTGSWDGTVQLWNIQPRRYVGIEMHREKDAIAVAFHPRGESVVSAHADRTVRLWNARTGQAFGKPMVHPRWVHSVSYSPDGGRVVTGCANGAAYVWDSGSGLMMTGPLQHSNTVRSAQFSPDGEEVATASEDGTARLWDSRTGSPVMPPLNHGDAVNTARFSANGRWIVTASNNKSARVWDARTGQAVTERLPHIDHVEWADFSPDSLRVVSASSDNTARVWDALTGKPIGQPLQHARTVQKAVFSPDGRRVATASLDRTARVWDANTGEALTAPLLHANSVRQVAFSADGRRVLTTGGMETWRLWDAVTGGPLAEWLHGCGSGEIASFDSTGRRVVTGSASGIVRIWDAPPAPTPVPTWFLAFAEGLAGMRLTAHHDMAFVSRHEFQEVTERLAQVSQVDFYERLGQWLLADPARQPTSPF